MLRLHHLRLRAITSSAAFGADLSFASGLNVIRAGNTSGKSTCLQSIIYALGLERSLGPQLEIPLPYAMRERIHRARDDDYEPVLESFVEIELENAEREILVVRRDIAGGKDTKLVQTWNAPRLSDPKARGDQRDFFVHDPGAAQREAGFHYYLSRFMGWELPEVPRYDGTEGPLYLEAVFPMLFVEQKRGWSAIQGPFPTFLRIQDIARYAMEFLLRFEASEIRRQRLELRRRISDVQKRWVDRRQFMEEQAGRLVRFRGIAPLPTAEFAHNPEMEIELLHQDDWVLIDTVIDETAARIRELEEVEIPSAESAAPEIEEALQGARIRADELSTSVETIADEIRTQLEEHNAVQNRISTLEADLRRNQDALKLRGLGSMLGRASGEGVCPTCHQSLSSELLPVVATVGMGLEENISFIRSQLDLYRATLTTSGQRIEELRARYEAAQQELRERLAEIRTLRQALVQPSASPSRAVIEELVRHQAFFERLNSIRERADAGMDEMISLASEWAELQDRLRRLPSDDLTSADRAKVNDFRDTVRRHLSRYGFKSFQPTEIDISPDNFRPITITVEDGELIQKELNFEISASDSIRLKWSYYVSLLSISRRFETNHSGLLIFDEPGQQEIEASSLHALLSWATANLAENQQMIIATSEPMESLNVPLADTNARVINFDGFILQPIQ